MGGNRFFLASLAVITMSPPPPDAAARHLPDDVPTPCAIGVRRMRRSLRVVASTTAPASIIGVADAPRDCRGNLYGELQQHEPQNKVGEHHREACRRAAKRSSNGVGEDRRAEHEDQYQRYPRHDLLSL